MRFLADENFPANAVKELKAAGHDVIWVATAAPGSGDEDVLALAAREERIILTFDKDFGELAAQGLPLSSGIILFRLLMPTSADVGTMLLARISERTDWSGHFAVIEPGRTRMRALASE